MHHFHKEDAIRLISKVKVGETIDVQSLTIISYNSYYRIMERWWSGESSEKLLKWICDIVLWLCAQSSIQHSVLVNVIHGVRNMAMTYSPSPESNTLDSYVFMIEELLYSPRTPTSPISIPSSSNKPNYARSYPG